MGEFDVKSDVANLEESFDTKKHFGVCDWSIQFSGGEGKIKRDFPVSVGY